MIVRDKYFHPGNIAIVTGAASGIGRATAIALGSLKCANYGGAPIYEEDLKAAVRKLGQMFVQLFGQAESPMTISYLRKEKHLLEGTPEPMKRLTSAGIPRTDVKVKIRMIKSCLPGKWEKSWCGERW